MGYDKVIDSAALEANLTTVADAIRAKGGTTDKLAFPSEYVTAIENIPTGTTLYAVIGVTYPEGSTCTATDDTITLSAPDPSGTWACVVPTSGTWTVTATNGTQTKSLDVSITAKGQVEKVTLSYALYLLKDGALATIDGTQLSLVVRSGQSNPTLTSEGIVSTDTSSYSRPFMLTPAVDFTGYSTLVFHVKSVSRDASYPKLFGASATAYTPGSYTSDKANLTTYTTLDKLTSDYVDVSVAIDSYQQAMYVCMCGAGAYSIDAIYLT